MNDQSQSSQDGLPPWVAERVNQTCDSFEAAWKAAESTGQRISRPKVVPTSHIRSTV